MPGTIDIAPGQACLNGEIILPLSKSISNRLLIMNFLSHGKVETGSLSTAEDTILMERMLSVISSGRFNEPVILDTKNAGTVFRFLTAVASIVPGKWLLTGGERMLHRQVQPLVEALQNLGADISYQGKMGFPPLLISGKPLWGGKVLLDVSNSSQYASALMLIAPVLQNGLEVKFTGKRVSMSYLHMSASLMRMAGIPVSLDNNGYHIPCSSFLQTRFDGEKDWSSASFWYETLALAQSGEIFFPGLTVSGVQGDRYCMDLFEKLGIKTIVRPEGIIIRKEDIIHEPVDEVLTDYPDLVLPFFTAMAGLQIPGRVQGIKHLQYKESDRIQTLSEELIRAGFNVISSEDALILKKGKYTPDNFILDAHEDHRIFMSMAPLCQVLGKIRVNGASSVNKSYPDFILQLHEMGFRVEMTGD